MPKAVAVTPSTPIIITPAKVTINRRELDSSENADRTVVIVTLWPFHHTPAVLVAEIQMIVRYII